MKILKTTIIVLIIIIAVLIIATISTKSYIVLPEDLKEMEAILILGCRVMPNGELSYMLKDRLDKGIELYENNVAPKIIVSGDHGRNDYDEVNAMKNYLIDKGIPSEDIFMDHAGFSTYDSVYRAKEIFSLSKMVIVTQKYHLYRALYIAKNFKIEAYGVSAEDIKYYGQFSREVREVVARNKEFIKCIIKPKPKYLGEKISINGDGNITNDEN